MTCVPIAWHAFDHVNHAVDRSRCSFGTSAGLALIYADAGLAAHQCIPLCQRELATPKNSTQPALGMLQIHSATHVCIQGVAVGAEPALHKLANLE